jgi:hypothetical protein
MMRDPPDVSHGGSTHQVTKMADKLKPDGFGNNVAICARAKGVRSKGS